MSICALAAKLDGALSEYRTAKPEDKHTALKRIGLIQMAFDREADLLRKQAEPGTYWAGGE